MLQPIEVRKVLINKVTDASGLEELIEKGVFSADDVIGVVGKTEGNGGVNDYTRLLADRAFREVLVAKGTRSWEEVRQIPLAWSGGTDGVLSPHATIFARIPASRAPVTDEPRISVGVAMSDQILPEEIGHEAMIEKVAEGVRRAMANAGITDPADVHYVQTKTPLLTLDTINDAKRRGKTVWTEDTLESMDLSNGTSGLGIAVALGEIEHADRRPSDARPLPLLLGGLVLVRRGAGPGSDRAGRQRPRHRRPLPDRSLDHGRRPRHGRRLAGDPQCRP